MKKQLFLTLLILFSVFVAQAQVPQKINYQAVIRNVAGEPLANQAVSLKMSILEGSSGSAQYVETHTVTTNSFGLIDLKIGGGAIVSGTLEGVQWSTGNKFLKLEVDVAGGNSYTEVSTVELVSVPYALNAATSADNRWDFSGNNIKNNNTGIVSIGSSAESSAKLDISATNKGLLIPRVTFANRPNPAVNGLLIYQTDNTPGFYFYDGSAWNRLAKGSEITGPNTGSIIPFASGSTTAITTKIGGLTGNVALLGFGNSAIIDGSTGTIDLNGATGTALNYAFVMPRNGTITSIYAMYSTTQALSLIGTSITINAQLYKAAAGSNSFSPVPGAVATMAPTLTGIAALGTTVNGSTTGLNITATAGERYLMVIGATATGLTLVNTITGYASGSVNIN